MKPISRFLLLCLSLGAYSAASAAPNPNTVGSNLTAYNNTTGAINNNMWANATNPRTSNEKTTAPKADLENCNAQIMRCATPKCANGGCVSMDVAKSIVSGCVAANKACKKHGNSLVEYSSAQLVANSTAAQNAAAAEVAAAEAAAQAAQDALSAQAAQNAEQMKQMADQMQQMQQQMQQQNQNLQNALAESQAATERAVADAVAAQKASAPVVVSPSSSDTSTSSSSTVASAEPSAAAYNAAAAGVSADVIARADISNQILQYVENAEQALKTMKVAMDDTFKYAGCTKNGDNCKGPKRISRFKNRAEKFFEPYDEVIDELNNALDLARALGVNVDDIYMMFSDACSTWGKYYCEEHQLLRYGPDSCTKQGDEYLSKDPQDYCPTKYNPQTKQWEKCTGATNRGITERMPCKIGDIIPERYGGCHPVGALADKEQVELNWINEADNDRVRIACMASVVENSFLGRAKKRRSKTVVDIDILQRMVDADAPDTIWNKNEDASSLFAYCSAAMKNDLNDLKKMVANKKLSSAICVNTNTVQNNKKAAYDENMRSVVTSSENASGQSSTSSTPPSQETVTIEGRTCRHDAQDASGVLAGMRASCINSGGCWKLKDLTCVDKEFVEDKDKHPDKYWWEE